MGPHPLDIYEFSGLADEMVELGIPVAHRPEVRREDTHTPDGLVSSLLWGIGPPEVVLLHGAGRSAHTWDALLLALGRPALAIDLPGHGRSAWREDGRYEPRIIALAVATVVERLAPDARMVVGQSLGGFAAIALGDMRDDLVGRQLLVDAVPDLPVRSTDRVLAGPDGPDRRDASDHRDTPDRRELPDGRDGPDEPDSFESRAEIVEWAVRRGSHMGRSALERSVVLDTVASGDGRWVWRHHLGRARSVARLGDVAALWPSLEAFPRAVTLLRAVLGVVSDAQVAELTRRVPTAEILSLPTGHDVQEEDPVGLARIVAERLGA